MSERSVDLLRKSDDAMALDEAAVAAASMETETEAEATGSPSTASTVSPAQGSPLSALPRRVKYRARTRSEGSAWTRSSLRMPALDAANGHGHDQGQVQVMRSSECALPSTRGLDGSEKHGSPFRLRCNSSLSADDAADHTDEEDDPDHNYGYSNGNGYGYGLADGSSVGYENDDDVEVGGGGDDALTRSVARTRTSPGHNRSRSHDGNHVLYSGRSPHHYHPHHHHHHQQQQQHSALAMQRRVQRLSREKCITMWREQGTISLRASEMLEDATLSLHGQETNLYHASVRRLSAAQDPMLNSLGEKLASAKSAVSLLDSAPTLVDEQNEEQEDGSGDGNVDGDGDAATAATTTITTTASATQELVDVALGGASPATTTTTTTTAATAATDGNEGFALEEASAGNGVEGTHLILEKMALAGPNATVAESTESLGPTPTSPPTSTTRTTPPEDGEGPTMDTVINRQLSIDDEDSSHRVRPQDHSAPLRTPPDLLHPEGMLYHEAVRWEGVLSRRSEWLRRVEKHYYVLEGKYLRRFASKEAYLASREDPAMHDRRRSSVTTPGGSSSGTSTSYLYVLAGVKDSSSRVNGFTFITEDKKTLQLNASTAVEKVIWMRLSLEAIVALPNLPVAPLDMEEFYAMLVVLYTAHVGKWRIEGDMAVTLPPPSEQVFTRFFRLLDRDIIFCSNYPPSVPFHGSFRGHAGVVSFMHEFAKHTKWTNFKIAGLSVEGSIAVASGKEDLENKRDGRRFSQNWVHKFMFYSDGTLARFEINGDVVAASAVFKVPGAATTLKLPQEFNEVDAEHGAQGTLLVHVLQGSGLKAGTNTKKVIKEPAVMMALVHSQHAGASAKQGNSKDASSAASSAVAAFSGMTLSMPALSRKFSAGMGLLSGVSTTTTSSGGGSGGSSTASSSSNGSTPSSETDTNANPSSTGAPRNMGQSSFTSANPVWNRVLVLPFEQVIGTCSLVMNLVDQSRGAGYEVKLGKVSVNVAKYIMSGHSGGPEEEEAAMASDARWYTVSNAKGEYCGKIMVGVTCRKPADETEMDVEIEMYSKKGVSTPARPRLRKSRSMMIDRHNPPTSRMLQLDTSMAVQSAMTPAGAFPIRATTPGSGSEGIDDPYHPHLPEYRRHGWANVKLSPETLTRPHSDGGAIASQSGLHEGPKKKPVVDSGSGRFESVVCKDNENMHTFMVCGAPFTIPKHYQLIKVCGRGAYGIVIAATNTMTGGNVGIKKVIDCVWHPHQLKQILREARLMRHHRHENLLSLMDLIPPSSYSEFRDVYMTMDLMEMDLHRIIYSKEVLLDDHIRYFLYQILSGLHHMHKAGVLHRDLKPSNLLVNSDCQLKICDLGLARSKDLDDNGMTEYVVTRWYRAPELLLGSAYGDGVDLWAAGCIFAEMLGRKPLFPGETYVHQLQLIMNVLGVPEEHSFKENPQANKLKGRQLLSRTHAVAGIDVSTMFPNANPEGLDLLWKMLVFDVDKRITVHEALRHPYLAAYYDEAREAEVVEQFESFDLDGLDETELKELMFKEICHFHPEEMEKRARQQMENPNSVDKLPPGWVKRESRSVPGKFYYSHPKRGISTWIKEEMD